MSGSMVYLDDNTPAPQKWVEVHKTVARIMRSLPDLEKYQIVTFSDRPHFPLGGDGKWLDYDPRTSADLVLQTLADVKPDGGTNMYGAMEAAFRYRKYGLDAVYLLSDGLPNLGEGVRPEEVSALTEVERAPGCRRSSARCSRPTGTATCRTGRASTSTRSGSFMKARTWGRSCGRWPARTTAASSG